MVESTHSADRGVIPGSIQFPGFLTSLARDIREFKDRITGRKERVSGGFGEPNQPELALTPPTTLTLQSRENYRDVKNLDLGNGDSITVFQGRAYLDNLPYLINAATLFLQRNVGWDESFCRELMTKGMGVDNLLPPGAELDEKSKDRIMARRAREVPSAFLYRLEDSHPTFREEKEGLLAGEYVESIGISVQKLLILKTKLAGEVPVLDHVLRVFEKDFRDNKRGRLSVGLALLTHQGARYYEHKTGSPVAVQANRGSSYLIQEGAHPFASRTISDPLTKEIRELSAPHILLPGRELLPNGVIKRDYPRPNEGFKLDELRGGALDMYKKMREEFGMHIDYSEGYQGEEGFDSVAPLYMVR